MMPWQPVIDGEVVPARPIDRIAAGAGADIDVHGRHEHRRGSCSWSPAARSTKSPTRRWLDRWPPTVRTAAYGLPVETVAAYRAAHPGASPGDLLAAIQTDWFCRIPAIRLADAHATARSGTYMYEFAWRSPQFGVASVPATRWRSRSSSTPSTDPTSIWDRCPAPRRNRSPTRCTAPGWRSPPRRPGLAEIRSQPEGDHALRHREPGSRGSACIRTGLWETAGRFAAPVAAGAR